MKISPWLLYIVAVISFDGAAIVYGIRAGSVSGGLQGAFIVTGIASAIAALVRADFDWRHGW